VNPRRILIALTLALFASGVCTWFASRRLSAPPATRSVPAPRYVAPSRALQAGEVLSPGNTELLAWPGAIPVDGAFSRIADVNGRAILYPLAPGQPILDRDLSAAGSGIGLATRIPDGMRAVALRSDEVVGVAGFLLPGSHVDVLVTCHSDRSPDPVTATVLEDVVVLATGHQVQPDPDNKTANTAVVTLLLSPEQSQRAVLASAQGAIHFVLRNSADPSRTGGAPTLLSQLAGSLPISPHPVIRPAAPAVQPTPKLRAIEVILGDSGEAKSIPIPDRGAGQ
jgi:pilus assembly protein CpaB